MDPQLDPGSPAQFNAYVYAGNNPLTWSDPSGLSWLSKAWHSTTSFVARHQAEIVGAVAGTVVFAGCMAATAGAGSIGCGAAAGAVGGAVTNLWKSQVQHTQAFSWKSLAMDTAIGAAAGAAGGAVGRVAARYVAPIAKRAAGAVSSAVGKVAPKAGAAVSKAGSAAESTAAKATAGACSFGAATPVLLADGATKPISDLQVGDQVLSKDPETGSDHAQPVEQVHEHQDTLVTLVIDGRPLVTTEDHPFWSVTDQQFERADHLAKGEKVLTADGTTASVDGLELDTVEYAPAYNLTISQSHTYYVVPGDATGSDATRAPPGSRAVLVHNTGSCPLPGAAAKAADDWPILSGIVRDAAKGKGNFGLGSGTASQAQRAGQSWVGDGFSVASDGKTLISRDGLRQWRPPSYKPNLDKWQSNFESRLVPRGQWQGNGHLDITDLP